TPNTNGGTGRLCPTVGLHRTSIASPQDPLPAGPSILQDLPSSRTSLPVQYLTQLKAAEGYSVDV
ncbi:unnamed protein product, partial [Nesidiocoris tenuis]